MSLLDAVRRDPKRLHLCLRVCPSSDSLLTQWNHATDQKSGRGWEWGWCKWWCHQWFLPAPFQNQKPQHAALEVVSCWCRPETSRKNNRLRVWWALSSYRCLDQPASAIPKSVGENPAASAAIGIPTRPHRLNTQVLFHPFISISILSVIALHLISVCWFILPLASPLFTIFKGIRAHQIFLDGNSLHNLFSCRVWEREGVVWKLNHDFSC